MPSELYSQANSLARATNLPNEGDRTSVRVPAPPPRPATLLPQQSTPPYTTNTRTEKEADSNASRQAAGRGAFSSTYSSSTILTPQEKNLNPMTKEEKLVIGSTESGGGGELGQTMPPTSARRRENFVGVKGLWGVGGSKKKAKLHQSRVGEAVKEGSNPIQIGNECDDDCDHNDDANTTSSISMSDRSSSLSMSQLISPLEKERLARVKRKYNDEGASTITISKEVKNKSAYSRNNSSGAADIVEVGYVVGEGLLSGPQHFLAPLEGLSPTPRRVMLNAQTRKAIIGGPRVAYANPAYYKHDFLGRGKKPVSDENKRKKEIKNNKKQIRRAEEEEGLNKEKGHLSSGSTSFDHDEGASSSAETSDPSDSSVRTADGQDEEHDDDDDHNRAHEKDQDEISDFVDAVLKRARRRGGATASVEQGYGMGKYISKSPSLSTSSAPEKRRRGQLSPLSLDSQSVSREFFQSVRDFQSARKKAFVRILAEGREASPSSHPVGIVPLSGFVDRYQEYRDAADDYDDHNNEEGEGGNYAVGGATSPPVRGTRKGRRVSFEEKRLFPKVFSSYLHNNNTNTKLDKRGGQADAGTTQKNNNITNTDDAHYTNIGKRADLGFDHLFSHHLHVHEQRDEEDPSGLLEHAFEEAVRRDKALHPHTNSAVEEELGLYERLSDPEAFSEWLQREVGIGSVGNHVNVVGGTEGPRTNGDEGQSGKGSPTHSDPSTAISLTALVARVALLEQETAVASANITSTFTDPTDDGLILNYSHSLQSNPQLNSKSKGREDDDTSSLAQAAGTSTATGTSKVIPLLDHQTYQQKPHESSPSTGDSFMNTTRSAKIRRIMISAAPYCRSVGEVDRFLHGYFSFSAAPFRREERDKVLSLENVDDPSSEESARDDGGSCGSGDKENEEEVRGGEAEEERPTLGALLKSFRAWRVTINPIRDEGGGVRVGGATDTVVNLAAHALTTNMKKHRIGRTSKTKWSSGKAEASRNNGDDDELKNNKWTTKITCTSPASSSSSSHVLLPTTEVHQQSSSYRKLSETSEIAMQLIGNAMGRLNAFSYPLSFDELHMDCANCLEGLQKDRQNLLGGNSTNGNSSAADTAATTKGGTAAGITAEARLINAIFGVEDRTPTNTRSNDVLETHDGDIHHRRMDSTKAAKGGGRGDDSANNSNIEDTNSKHNNNNNNNKSTYNNIANTVAVSAITRETPVAVHVKGPVLMHVPYVDSNKALDKAHDAVIALSIALAQEEEKEEEDQKEKETRRERTKLTDEEEEEAKGSAKSTFVAFAPAPSPPPQPLGFSFPLPLSTCTKKEYDEEAGNAASISSTSAKNILQQTFAVVGKGRKSILTLIPQSQSPTIKNVAHISGGDEGTTAPTLFKTPLQLSDEEEEDESNKKDRNPQATLFLRKLAKRMSISLQGEGSLLGSCSTSMRARKEEDTCTGGGDGLSPRRGEGGENNSTVAFVEAEVETSGVQKIDGPTVATATPTTTTKEGSEPKTKISKELCRKRQSLVSTVVAGVPVHQIRGTFFRALSFLRNPDEDPLFAAQSFLLANNGDINSSSAKEHPLNNYRIKEHTQSTLLSEKNSSSDLLTPSALAYEAYVMQREKETPTYLICRGSSSSSPQPRAVSGLSKPSLPDGRHNLNKIWPSEDGVSSIVEATAAQRRTNASASHVWRLEETAAAHGVAVESLIATYIRLLVDRDRCGEDRYSSLAGGGDRRAGATPANRNDLGLLLGDDTSSFLLRSYTYLSAVDITEMLGQLQLFSSTLVAPAPPADSESRNRSQHSLDERQNLRRRSTLEFRKDAEDEGKERIVYVHAEMLPNNSPNRCAAANPMSETNKMITCTQPEEVVGVDKEVSTRGFMAGFHESFEAFAGGSADVIRIVPQHASGSVGATGTDCFFPSSSSSFSLSASNALHHPNAPSHRQLSNRKKKSADNDTISSSRADVRKDSTSSLYPSSHGKSIPASSIAWLKQQGSEYFIFPMPSQEGVVAHDRRGEYRRGAGGKRGDDETQGNDGGLNIDDVSHQRHRGKYTFPPESELRDGEEEVFSFEGYNKTRRPLVAAAAASVLTPKDIRLAFDLDYEEAVPGGGWLTTLDQLIKHVKHQLLPITHCILEPVSVVGFFLGKLAVFLKCQVAIDEEDAVSRDEVLALINTILSERLSKFSSAALTLEAQITELEKMEQDEVRVRRLMENDLLGPLELIVGQLLRNVPFFHQREALSLASEDIIRRSAAVMDFLHELESTAPSSVGAADQWVRSLIDEGYARLEANVARGWATLSCGFIDPALRKFVIDTDPYAKENRGNEVLAKIVGSEFIVDDDGKARRVGGRGMSRQFGAAAGPSLLLSLAAQQQQHPAGSLVRQYLFDLTEHSVSRLESLMKRKRRGADHVDTDGDSYDENGHDTTEPEGGERYNTAVNNDDGRGAAHSPARGRGGGGAVASDGDVGVLVGMTGSHRNKTKKRADAAAPTLRERVAALGLRVISVPSLIKRFACEYKLSFSLVALKVKGVASESIGRQLCLSARHFLDEAGAEYDTLWGFCAGLASSEGI